MVCTSCLDIVGPPSAHMNSDEHSFEAPTGDFSRRKAVSSAFSYHGLANAQQLHHRAGPTQPFFLRPAVKYSEMQLPPSYTLRCGYTALRAKPKASFLKFFNQVTKISTRLRSPPIPLISHHCGGASDSRTRNELLFDYLAKTRF
jgi:hypothetical protein